MKDFVPYQEALELKQLGFDEPCLGWFASDRTLVKEVTEKTDFTLAPTYSQAFRWFREKYGLEIILRPDAINAPEKKLREYVILSYDESWILEPIAEPQWWIRKGLFETYEEAELQCLKQLIKIVKEQQK